jgi:hypothetical protein
MKKRRKPLFLCSFFHVFLYPYFFIPLIIVLRLFLTELTQYKRLTRKSLRTMLNKNTH